MDIQPKRREKRKKTQTFYPSPQSFSEADQYEYSSEDEDDESSYDGDFKKTLVSSLHVPECHTRGMLENDQVHHYFPSSAWLAANARETLVDPFSAVKNFFSFFFFLLVATIFIFPSQFPRDFGDFFVVGFR